MARGRGRPPLAPEVHEANGTYRLHPERRNPNAPKANMRDPDKPDWFDEYASSKWDELLKDLRDMGILSSECRELMIAYCTSYSGWMTARDAVVKTGIVLVKTKNGETVLKRNHFTTEMHKFRAEMNNLLPELGLTPSARSRMQSINHEDGNPFEDLLEKMGGSLN